MNNACDSLLDRLEGKTLKRATVTVLDKVFDPAPKALKTLAPIVFQYILKPYLRSQLPEKTVTFKHRVTTQLIELLVDSFDEVTSNCSKKIVSTTSMVNLKSYQGILEKVKKVNEASCPVNCLVILLYGPPGTGKSGIARFLSSSLGSGLARIRLKDEDGRLVTAEAIREMISDQYSGTVFLLDEIDTITDPAELTLMNEFLDEVRGMTEKFTIVMTTNYIDKVKDLPMCRPGRVDITREISHLADSDVTSLCQKWNTDEAKVRERVTLPLTVAKVTQACRDIVLEELIEKGDLC